MSVQLKKLMERARDERLNLYGQEIWHKGNKIVGTLSSIKRSEDMREAGYMLEASATLRIRAYAGAPTIGDEVIIDQKVYEVVDINEKMLSGELILKVRERL